MSDLPPGWEWSTLEELAAVEDRPITDGPFGSNLKSSHYTESGARVLRLQNIGDGFFRDERAYISEEHFERLRAHEAREGDLLIASLGEAPPRACLIPALDTPAIVKADCIRVRLHPGVDPRWVLYSLISPETKKRAAALIKGVGRPRLGLSQIRSLPVPVPPPVEQRRIVVALESHISHLDAGDNLVQKSQSTLKKLTRELIINAVDSVKAELITTVGEAGAVDLGRQRHPDWHTGANMRPYLRVANVFENRIDLEDVKEMHFPDDTFARFELHPGDILLNEGQSPEYLGRPAMYSGPPERMAFTNSLLRFRTKKNVLPEWALLVFRRHMHAKRFMQEVRITTNLAHLSAGRLKSVEFPIPNMEAQRQAVDGFKDESSELDRLAHSLEGARRQFSSLRRSLLADAFAGRLVPQDPADEPASALLDRIRAERAAQPKPRRTRRSAP